MNTREILVAAERLSKGYARANELLPILADAVDILMMHPCPQTMIVDPLTGLLPVLNTNDGIYTYEAPALTLSGDTVNAYHVGAVLVNPETYLTDYNFSNIGVNDTEWVEIGGRYYYPYLNVKTYDGYNRNPAVIVFSVNPGTTTGYFYVQEYVYPPRIESDREEVPCPDRDGAHRMILLPTMMKLIEAEQHGNYTEAIEYINEYLKPKMWAILNAGAQGCEHRTIPRPY
ncbi:MAG: hypothetical protein ABIH23_13170 [bacterium]